MGGRLAAQAALRGLGRSPSPVLSGPRGAPTGPKGLNVSISHKNNLAVALVARSELGSIGIDLEHLEPARHGVAERVLRPEELEAVRALPQERQWVATVLRFTIKEAIYKALAPRLVRYIGFDEASVAPGVNGDAEIRLFLKSGDGPAHIEARYIWLSTAVLATVRATWSPGTPATKSP